MKHSRVASFHSFANKIRACEKHMSVVFLLLAIGSSKKKKPRGTEKKKKKRRKRDGILS